MLRPFLSLFGLLYIWANVQIVSLTELSPPRQQRIVADFDLNEPAVAEDDSNHISHPKRQAQCEHNVNCVHWLTLTKADKTKVYWDRYIKRTPKELFKLKAKMRNKKYREKKAIPILERKRINRLKYEKDPTRPYVYLTEEEKRISRMRHARRESKLINKIQKDQKS